MTSLLIVSMLMFTSCVTAKDVTNSFDTVLAKKVLVGTKVSSTDIGVLSTGTAARVTVLEGQVSAVTLGDALRTIQSNTNAWLGVEGGTAFLYRVESPRLVVSYTNGVKDANGYLPEIGTVFTNYAAPGLEPRFLGPPYQIVIGNSGPPTFTPIYGPGYWSDTKDFGLIRVNDTYGAFSAAAGSFLGPFTAGYGWTIGFSWLGSPPGTDYFSTNKYQIAVDGASGVTLGDTRLIGTTYLYYSNSLNYVSMWANLQGVYFQGTSNGVNSVVLTNSFVYP